MISVFSQNKYLRGINAISGSLVDKASSRRLDVRTQASAKDVGADYITALRQDQQPIGSPKTDSDSKMIMSHLFQNDYVPDITQ
jgi:hypothetical protein